MKSMLIVSIISNLVLLSLLLVVSWKSGLLNSALGKFNSQTTTYSDNIFYQERISLFNEIQESEGQVVFLGDSITQRSEWSELFPNARIVNRGIGNDTSEGVLNRIGDILESNPSKIFLMIGVNDLSYNIDMSSIVDNHRKIINEIHEKNPNVEVFLQSVLPINKSLYGGTVNNNEIKLLNDELRLLANETGVEFVDLYSEFLNEGELSEEFTIDGIHLSGKGFVEWKEFISKMVQ